MEQVLQEAFTVSDSIFLVLLIGLALGTWWIIRYVFQKNDEREKRYIDVIDTQAKGLQGIDELKSDVKEIKNREGELRVVLQKEDKEYTATASLNNSELCSTLSNAVPTGKSINLEINARDFEGEKRDLVIISFKQMPEILSQNQG